jgi:hypothetical protein
MFLDKYAERTEDGSLKRELIGVYFNYQLQFGQSNDNVAYEALWNKLTEPTEFHTVIVPDETGDFTFTAYFSNIADELRRKQGTSTFWKSLTVNFIAQSPARTP